MEYEIEEQQHMETNSQQTGKVSRPKSDETTRSEILRKLRRRLSEMQPDVIVTHANKTALFTPQNRRASEWLHLRCGLTAEKISGDTEIRVHPRKCQRVITDLKTAGFLVAGEKEES